MGEGVSIINKKLTRKFLWGTRLFIVFFSKKIFLNIGSPYRMLTEAEDLLKF